MFAIWGVIIAGSIFWAVLQSGRRCGNHHSETDWWPR